VLQLALSPNGRTVCSAGDETLRFWTIFEPDEKDELETAMSLKFAGRIRQRKSAGSRASLRARPHVPARNGLIGKTSLSSHQMYPLGLLR
jgi:hypothetical protein